jgi:cytidylate kinase
VIVTVDGPVAAGKGTLSRRLAADLGFAHLDTGMIYRAVGCKVMWAGGDPANEALALQAAERLNPADLTAEGLRDEAAGLAASKVAVIPSVRAALLEYQRRFAARPPGGEPGAVLDGRDTGTVVCPQAEAKLFVTASAQVRARRRYLELHNRGETITEAEVLADLVARDKRDSERAVAPLKPAPDAHLLDTSDLDIDAAFRAARAFVAGRLGR